MSAGDTPAAHQICRLLSRPLSPVHRRIADGPSFRRTGTYGEPFLGLHFYTRAAILFDLIVVGSAVLLLFDARLDTSSAEAAPIGIQARIALVVFALLVVGNALSIFLE